MTKEERVRAVLAGQEADRIPVSVWMHLSEYDQDPRSLAEAMVAMNKKFDYDFIKMMPFGAYMVPDWGGKLDIYCDKYKEVEIADAGLKTVEDFYAIEPLPPVYGTWGKTLQMAQWTVKLADADTPCLQTVFSPASSLKKLAGAKMLSLMVEEPEAVHHALQVITETTVNFVKANIDAGVSGFFFATQCATYDLLNDVTFAEFVKPYDMQVINAFKGKTWFNVCHIHGKNIMFDTMMKYPIDVLNWHDRQTGPTLREARKKTDKVFLGGLREGPEIVGSHLVYDSIMAKEDATPESIRAHIREAIDMVGGKGLMIGPGCVADPRASDECLMAVRKAVEA
ncbi:MAG: uroporphyrinogen decarboxylase [Oscillospiraceae bacterium]|nr:uroporphyrinogen decarboxylase [Oscillospiraceae bacterium]